ncbi:unnamed protein product [Protopolystoma xenopodis]|uniref:Uncharacterized protein n=1 Tax=Protopolystoma xenopodis TaxID=117903 RepID=A0A448X319_9PLAT|nr:unnamed protein product [Protopolystoma xenopodis]
MILSLKYPSNFFNPDLSLLAILSDPIDAETYYSQYDDFQDLAEAEEDINFDKLSSSDKDSLTSSDTEDGAVELGEVKNDNLKLYSIGKENRRESVMLNYFKAALKQPSELKTSQKNG